MNEAEVKTVAAALYADYCAANGGDGDYGKLSLYECLPWRSAACAAIAALDKHRYGQNLNLKFVRVSSRYSPGPIRVGRPHG